MPRFDTELVRRYYERHTQTFVAFGQGGSSGTMHRAVWARGVTGRAQAFRYVEDQIAVLARGLSRSDGALRLIDLGCGVGGSLSYLTERLPSAVATGITLSRTQAGLAERRLRDAGLSDRVTVIAGDYTEIPDQVEPSDLVFAIESFVHAPDAARFFAQCRRVIRPGGALVICDDFLRGAAGPEAIAAIEQFCRGWHINTLLEPEDLRAAAAAAGFEHESTTDLSRYVEIDRPRDRAAAVLAAVIGQLPWRPSRLDPWIGGSALQTCLRNGWLGYDFAVFRVAR